MADWFGRPVLSVANVPASVAFYARLGFTSPWGYDEDGRQVVAQVERDGVALILSSQWPDKIGKGVVFVSINADPAGQIAALDALRAELSGRGVAVTDGEWGYRVLVVDDLDGNRLLFNYPNAS
jgi:catechol 2,3-dioxygenase-like lactoylglutathione lyase family enzyme